MIRVKIALATWATGPSARETSMADLLALVETAKFLGATEAWASDDGWLTMSVPVAGVQAAMRRIEQAEQPADVVRVVPASSIGINAPSAPPAPAEQPAAPKVDPAKAKRPKQPGSGRPSGVPGTCRHSLFTTLADAGGRWSGSAAELAETWAVPATAKTEIRKAATAGLLEQHQPNGRKVTAITLTDAGWKFLKRTPPTGAARPVAAVPDVPEEPPVPKIPDLGPMERRPFDPDAVRQAQADAL